MKAVRYVKLGADQAEYPICFSSNAIYKLEERAGMTLARIGLLLRLGQGGIKLMQMMLWAGLEGGRLRAKTSHGTWDLNHVGDLVDETDGGFSEVWREEDDGEKAPDGTVIRPPVALHPVHQAMLDAFKDAFPNIRKDEPVAPDPQ
jgi:hypothetical protein